MINSRCARPSTQLRRYDDGGHGLASQTFGLERHQIVLASDRMMFGAVMRPCEKHPFALLGGLRSLLNWVFFPLIAPIVLCRFGGTTDR